jgi:hypothetical protein
MEDKKPIEDYTNLITNVPEVGESNIRVIVYGDYGVGKTRLLGTFPNVLLLNYDRGEKTLAGKKVACINFSKYATDKDGNEISAQNYERTVQILNDAVNRTGPFAKGGPLEHIQTIALDDLTTLSAFILYDLKKFSKHKVRDPELDKAEYKHYDAVANLVIRILELLKMATENFNIITTAGQKLDENEVTKRQLGYPNLVGKTRQRLGHFFDCIWHMEIEGVGQKRQYVLHMGPHTPFTGKSRGEGKQGGKIIDPNYEKIMNSLGESK